MGLLWQHLEKHVDLMSGNRKVGQNGVKGKAFVADALADELHVVFHLHAHGAGEMQIEVVGDGCAAVGLSEEKARDIVDAVKQEVASKARGPAASSSSSPAAP